MPDIPTLMPYQVQGPNVLNALATVEQIKNARAYNALTRMRMANMPQELAAAQQKETRLAQQSEFDQAFRAVQQALNTLKETGDEGAANAVYQRLNPNPDQNIQFKSKGKDVSIRLPDGTEMEGPAPLLADWVDAHVQDPTRVTDENNNAADLDFMIRNGVSFKAPKPPSGLTEEEFKRREEIKGQMREKYRAPNTKLTQEEWEKRETFKAKLKGKKGGVPKSTGALETEILNKYRKGKDLNERDLITLQHIDEQEIMRSAASLLKDDIRFKMKKGEEKIEYLQDFASDIRKYATERLASLGKPKKETKSEEERPPQSALDQIEPGKSVMFRNGQIWAKREDGTVERVK